MAQPAAALSSSLTASCRASSSTPATSNYPASPHRTLDDPANPGSNGRAPLTEEEAKKRKPAARFETYMDDRMVVPSGLSEAPPLNGKSSIPSHFPLEVLVGRSLVGRDIEPKPFDLKPLTDYIPVAVMGPRVG